MYRLFVKRRAVQTTNEVMIITGEAEVLPKAGAGDARVTVGKIREEDVERALVLSQV